MRVAEADEAGAFGVAGEATGEADGAQFVWFPPGWTHFGHSLS